MTIRGSCLCGGVSYTVSGPLKFMNHCHCARCRKAHGATYASFIWADTDDFAWQTGKDLVQPFEGPGDYPRQFCKVCGSKLPTIMGDQVELPAGGLDTDPGPLPAFHVFVASKAPFYEIIDDLPQHNELPAVWPG